jgi:dTDP-4-amino-4,6-dideoxygalactose transaminase
MTLQTWDLRATGYRIPFHRPYRSGAEAAHVERALQLDHWDGDGDATRMCEALLEAELGVERALLTTSCTHALEMAALLLDLGPGDEVIVPSFTFMSTANAFALRGARIVFCDVREDTLCMDEAQLPSLVTARTRAIVPVHYGGVACAMGPILDLADAHGIAVVEDNAHGVFARLDGRPLGSFGRLATLSFHATKNITCGEGGALLLNDDALIDRAEMIRQKGTDRAQFLAGRVPEYRWQTLGSSYALSELLAAVLLAQLDARDTIAATRALAWNRYRQELADWAEREGVTLPHVPAGAEHPAHLFYVVVPTERDRAELLAHLSRHGIQGTFHYTPLHSAPAGLEVGRAPLGARVTESIASRIVRLPLYPDLTPADQDDVIAAVSSFRCSSRQPGH